MVEKNIPVYVKIDEYEDLINVFEVIKKNIKDAKSLLGRITELKVQEDQELENWQSEITEVEAKIRFIDETLFETKD